MTITLQKYTLVGCDRSPVTQSSQQCTDNCTSLSYIYDIPNREDAHAQICLTSQESCPPITNETKYDSYDKNQENRCVQACTGNYAYPYNQTKNIICDNNCTFIQLEDKKECTEDNQQCPSEKYTLIYKIREDPSRYQCTEHCSDISDQLYRKNNTCLDSCGYLMREPVVWRQKDNDKVCDENGLSGCSTRRKEYEVNDTQECVEQCPEQYKYIFNNDLCISSCKDSIYKFVSSQDNQCIQQCQMNDEEHSNSTWYIDNDNQQKCRESTTCDEETYLIGDTMQCGQCPYQQEDLQYQYIDDNKCVSQCLQDKQFISEITCIDKCSSGDLIYIQAESQICQQSCGQDETENQYMWYYNQDNERQCTTQIHCKDIQEYNFKDYSQDSQNQTIYFCSNKCQNNVWQIIDNENTCIEQCGNEKDKSTINIQTYQCAELTNQQCYQILHIEIQFQNTQCQYISDAESCQQYQQYQNSIYQYQNDTTCTNCQQDDFEIKLIDNIEMCVLKEEESNKLSTGVIIGIAIATAVVIVIIILCSMLIIKKCKQSHNEQQNEMFNNKENQSTDMNAQKPSIYL